MLSFLYLFYEVNLELKDNKFAQLKETFFCHNRFMPAKLSCGDGRHCQSVKLKFSYLFLLIQLLNFSVP